MAVEKSTPKVRETKKGVHYGVLGDEHTPQGRIPVCPCGKLAHGGVIESFADVHPQGEPVMDLKFLCRACAGDAHFAVRSDAIWPYYDVVRNFGGGRMRLKRMTREQATARVRARMQGVARGPA